MTTVDTVCCFKLCYEGLFKQEDIIFPFLAYKEAVQNEDGKYQNCTDDEREKGSKPCIMDLTSLGECYNNSSDFQYGYDEDKPCIFMKLNRVSSSFYQFDVDVKKLFVFTIHPGTSSSGTCFKNWPILAVLRAR